MRLLAFQGLCLSVQHLSTLRTVPIVATPVPVNYPRGP